MITSKTNPKIKWFRRLQSDRQYRLREQVFVAEGDRWLREVKQQNISPKAILATSRWLNDPVNHTLLGEPAENVWPVSDQVMDHASTMVSPPGVLIALEIPTKSLSDPATFLLILDGIRNPGNLGTILRTAAAAGADGVILAPECVDAFNPKAVRGGMGAHLRLPIQQATWPEISHLTVDLQVWLASPLATIAYDQVDWRRPSALIVGSEAAGIGEKAGVPGSNQLTIPMSRGVESLNVAVATGIILFEAARQRLDT